MCNCCIYVEDICKMYGTHRFKIIHAQQARIFNSYKNVEKKLQNADASIWFNKLCTEKNLTPQYVHIRVNGNNVQSINTKLTALKYRLNQEIQFLYRKKQDGNEQLYKLYLDCASSWCGMWQYTFTYLLTYLHTYLHHGAESFLRS